MSKLSLVLITFTILSLLGFIFYHPHFNLADQSLFGQADSRFSLTTTDCKLLAINPVYLPPVTHNPADSKYRLITFLESYQLATNQHDRLFFAEKRVAEMQNWKDSLLVSSNIDLNRRYDSWDFELARYYSLMNESISSDLMVRTGDIQRSLFQNRILIEEVIKSANISPENRLRILGLSGSIFDDLFAKADLKSCLNDQVGTYSLKKIQDNTDFGIYQVSFSLDDKNLSHNASSSATLEVGDKIYTPEVSAKNQFRRVLFENVEINSGADLLRLNLEPMNQNQPNAFPRLLMEKVENLNNFSVNFKSLGGDSYKVVLDNFSAEQKNILLSSVNLAFHPSSMKYISGSKLQIEFKPWLKNLLWSLFCLFSILAILSLLLKKIRGVGEKLQVRIYKSSGGIARAARFISKWSVFIVIVDVLLIGGDIFLLKLNFDLITFLISVTLIMVLLSSEKYNKLLLALVTLLLILSLTLASTNPVISHPIISHKAADWVFILILIGIVKLVIKQTLRKLNNEES